LTKAYLPHVKSAIRKIALINNRIIMIQDDIIWAGDKKNVCWNLLTDAEISISGSNAELRKRNKSLYAKILAPVDSVFSISSAEQAPPQKSNAGFKQLQIIFEEKREKTIIHVVISSKRTEKTDVILDQT
jgi:hypothetical protein